LAGAEERAFTASRRHTSGSRLEEEISEAAESEVAEEVNWLPPQGFEPRYADPEARDLRFCGIPAVVLTSQEIPFFSMRY
jgi:hypothetical protein